MAHHKLYLNENCEGQVGKGTKYKYEDGVLEIEWYGERAWFYFEPKTAVLVKCEGALPDVVPLIAPKNFRWRVLWLCGIPKQRRCSHHAEFIAKALEEKPLRISEGVGWKVAWELDEHGNERVAFGWISGKVTDSDVRRLVDECKVKAPDWFCEQVLGLQEAER